MKIAFVNDCVERLGVEYISAILKNNGHQVQLFVDPQIFNNVYMQINRLSRYFDYSEKIIKDLVTYQPDLIGFSVDTESYQWASRTARRIKAHLRTPIIFGGIHPTSVPERVILNDSVDILCVGEGEYPMLELADSMSRGRMDMSIKNLWFKTNGKIIKNPLAPLVYDLDTLPFPDHGLFYNYYPYFQKGYSTVASRGCPYACSYCAHAYLRQLYQRNGAYFRHRSVENILEELEQRLSQYPIDIITFFDDNFGSDPSWLEKFSVRYAQTVGRRFTVTTHPEMVSRDYVRLLKQAGCCSVTLGIQTWDNTVRKDWFNRDVSQATMLKAMRLIKDARLELICDNIFGVPVVNDDAYIRSLLPYTDIKPDRILFNQLKYFPRVPITEKAREENFISAGRYESIMEGQDQKGVFLGPDERDRQIQKNSLKMKSFLFLMDCLPKTWAKFIINKRLYRYFPAFINPAFVLILRTFLSSDTDTRYFKRRTLSRYGYHLTRCLRGPRRGHEHSK